MKTAKRSCLQDPRVEDVLKLLHATAERVDPPLLARAEGKSTAERSAILAEAFIPVSPEAGRFLYTLARGCESGLIVEFGTSFAISTLYLAAAVRDRGAGKVITTEISTDKAAKARRNLEEAGLLDVVDLRVGDAQQTLKNLPANVALVFLDGRKDLYLPVLEMLEPALLPGALVVADDLDLFPDILKPYLAYVRSPSNGYVSVSVPLGDAMEVSSRAF